MLQNKIKANSLSFKNYFLAFLISMGNAFTEWAKVKVNRFYWNRNANEGTYAIEKARSSLPVHKLESENHLLKRLSKLLGSRQADEEKCHSLRTSRNFLIYFSSHLLVNKILRLGSERAALFLLFGRDLSPS